MWRNRKMRLWCAVIMLGMAFVMSGSVSAAGGGWIGTGSGTGGGGGGSSSCDSSNNYFQEDCAGWSWMYYKATKSTNRDIAFPQLVSDSGLTVTNATIPAECSQHGTDGGFWHKGANLINGCIVGNGITRSCGGNAWTGHWYTVGWTDWIDEKRPTVTSSTPRQMVGGVYRMSKTGSSSDALKDYKAALKYMGERTTGIKSMPDDVWGFCYWPGMEQVTLTVKAVDNSGHSLSHLMSDKKKTVDPGEEAVVTVGKIEGYRFLGFRSRKTSGTPALGEEPEGRKLRIAELNEDTTRYAVYEPIEVEMGECGKWTPSSYTNSDVYSGVTSTVSKVRNTSLANDWKDYVYAKPGNKVDWIHCYYPGVQTTAFTEVIINEEGDTALMKDLARRWENRFAVTSFEARFNASKSFVIGNYNVPDPKENNDFTIGNNHVGSQLTETIKTGEPRNASTDGENYSINQSTYSSSATAYVPYNYVNSTNMEAEDYFYAGENDTVTNNIVTSPKTNSLTSPNDEYATIVRNAKRAVRICYNEGGAERCEEIANGSFKVSSGSPDNVLNPSGTVEGDTFTEKIDFVVPDLSAGTEICFSSRVYPSNSGSDSNIDPNGSGVWSEWSSPICFKVAKRPSLQVWGGNVYSSGSIKTSRSVKQVVNGSDNSQKPYIFGSWGELGVISAGTVSGFASGASTGYRSNTNGALWPNAYGNADGEIIGSNYPGGGHGGDNFCKYSPLTIANECAPGSADVSGIGNSDVEKTVAGDKSIIANLMDSNVKTMDVTSNEISIDGFNDDDTVMYKKSGGDLIVNASTLIKDTFKIVYVTNGDVIINGDIKVADGIMMENFNQAPKLVIYAKKDVKIRCSVTRVDAIIVADGTVTTCDPGFDLNAELDSDDDNYNDNVNLGVFSRQLVVKGAIIAKSLVANRTYGAARGINSMVSAEIINFDPTLYLWGGAAGENGGDDGGNPLSGDLVTTYIHELSPRY